MPSRSTRNQVSFVRPGTASIFTPKDGTAQEWMTSVEVVRTRTSVLIGTTTALSDSSSRGCPGFRSSSATMSASKVKLPLSGYSYDQFHWWPIALIVISGLGVRSAK